MKKKPQDNIHLKALSFAGTAFLTILSILAIVAILFLFKGQRSYDENTISVTGTAEVSGAPDIATFSFTVSEVADEPESAQDIISEKVANILDGLDALDINEDDIRTDSYSINPRYEWIREADSDPLSSYYPSGKQVLTGYDVRQTVRVTLRDLDRVGEALSLFAVQKVENLYGPSFEIDDPEGLQEEARLQAIDDAKAKAKRLADDLGVRLGKIVSFSEGGYGYPQPYFARAELATMSYDGGDMDEKAYAPELPVGQNDISSTVTITYKIK